MMKVFATFDSKAAQFGQPMFIPTRGLALRVFSDAVAEKGSPLFKYAEDYSLYELGEYDPATGKLSSLPQPEVLATACAVKEQLRVAALDPDAVPPGRFLTNAEREVFNGKEEK